MNDPVTDYALMVLDGKILAGPYVIWACDRHMQDLKRDDIYLDLKIVNQHIDFFKILKHYKGRQFSGQPIELSLWQMFIQGSVFGWIRKETGLRRFNESYVEVPRKNGKSTIAAGTGLYSMVLDGEAGAEIYAVATKRDQAKIVWNDAKSMVLKSPALAKRMNCYVSNISMPLKSSKFEPLGRDSKTHDGLNPSLGIVDELHAWEDRLMWDQVEDAMGAREQGLIYTITTAGNNPESFCREKHEHGVNVLNPEMEDYTDDTFFAYIATVGNPDAIDDPLQWAMANPNLGISKRLEFMEDQYRKARHFPSRQTAFKVKQLNIWCNAADSWIDFAQWKKAECADMKIDQFFDQECYLGVDLGETNDMSALSVLFPGAEGIWRAFFIYWCPKEDIIYRSKNDKVPYDEWCRQKYLIATPGNATDFDFIEAEIRILVEKLNVKELLYDRWKSAYIVQNLMRDEVVTCVPYGQGYKDASPALKEIERRLLNGTLQVEKNPVLSWNAANVITNSDPAGNIKLNKSKPRKRIDGISALMNAVGGAMLNREQEINEYQGMGVIGL